MTAMLSIPFWIQDGYNDNIRLSFRPHLSIPFWIQDEITTSGDILRLRNFQFLFGFKENGLAIMFVRYDAFNSFLDSSKWVVVDERSGAEYFQFLFGFKEEKRSG